MNEDEQHEARLVAGQAAMSCMDVVENPDFQASRTDLIEATIRLQRILRDADIPTDAAISVIVGLVVAAALTTDF